MSPADAPHGELHLQLCALLEAHTGYEFQAACDLLTRTSRGDDLAPDASVYPAAPHPETGGRQLEQLAFEIVSTESLAHASDKAAKLTRRGVRRVFAIDIERHRVLEWSAALASWTELDAAGHIEDPALDAPLPINDMIHAAKADDAIARALILRHNPVIEQMRASDRAEGRAMGLAEAVLTVLAARGVILGFADRGRILDERDPAQLERWLARATTCTEIRELFAAM